MRVVDSFETQASACAHLGSPMYADLVAACAEDFTDGGPVAEVLAGHEDDPGPSALALRLMGSVHRLVLERRAGELATYYPSVGGTYERDGCWAAFRALLAEDPEAVREWLDRPPQTNEVGRAAALYGGLLHVPTLHRLPVRLFEIGSSGGLNLNADRYAYLDEDGRRFGVQGAGQDVMVLDPAWRGTPVEPWPRLEFVQRTGSDVRPVDAASTEGRLVLTAYVWPDQVARHERLRGALALAASRPLDVRRQPARDLVGGIELAEGHLTVLWHSVMWQYLDRAEQDDVSASIERLGASATDDAPFAHLFLEPWRRTPESGHEFLVELRVWPSGERRILGTGVGHGLPCTWE